MSSIKTVRQLKEDLLKELSRPGGDGRTEKIMDIVQRLNRVDMDLTVLTGTLIGASVSKLKNHEDVDVSSAARDLVKKWKGIARLAQGNDVAASSAASTAKPAASAGSDGKGPPKAGQLKRMASAGSSDLGGESEWQGLPQFRINICKKLHGIFLLSGDDLSKELNGSAVKQLCLARAGEVEAAIDAWSRGEKDSYTDKVRDLVFNLKKNAPLREQVILGQISPGQLPRMSAGELQTEEKAKERDETLKKLQDSRR